MLIAGTNIYAPKLISNVVDTMKNANAKVRVACISLGIATEGSSLYHHFDVGLSNASSGWYPSMRGRDFLTK